MYMFTGIIEHIGTVTHQDGARYTVRAPKAIIAKLKHGTSIAVNGICLTVVDKKKDSFAIEVMPETRMKTVLKQLRPGSEVNLELPATPTTFLSGHVVQGHIDGQGTVKKITPEGNSRMLTVGIPQPFSRYIVPKGSITLNGVSLTVISARKSECTVGIIPFTWRHSMFKHLKSGDAVNIEVDVLAKYAERLLQKKL